jgi:hypothetical protein
MCSDAVSQDVWVRRQERAAEMTQIELGPVNKSKDDPVELPQISAFGLAL